VRLLADGTYGEINYRPIRRTVQLGPAVRVNDGETDGNYVAGVARRGGEPVKWADWSASDADRGK
jgi:hypothetical protein